VRPVDFEHSDARKGHRLTPVLFCVQLGYALACVKLGNILNGSKAAISIFVAGMGGKRSLAVSEIRPEAQR
jgi:hypothetical protein